MAPEAKVKKPATRDEPDRDTGVRKQPTGTGKGTAVAVIDASEAAARLVQMIGAEAMSGLKASKTVVGIAGSKVSQLVEQLARDEKVQWEPLGDSLAAMYGALQLLDGRLRKQKLGVVADEVDASITLLAARMPSKAAERMRSATPNKDATFDTGGNEQKLELVAFELSALKSSAAAARATASANNRDEIIAACVSLAASMQATTSQLVAVGDRKSRTRLKPHVEAISVELDAIAEWMAMSPRMPWHATLAATFDAENRLRAAQGLVTRPRPYSGTVDPARALEIVRAAPTKKQDGATTSATPEQAVAKIAIGMNAIYDKRLKAIDELGGNLQDPPPPEDASAAMIVMKTLGQLTLSYVAGALGTLVGGIAQKALDGRAARHGLSERAIAALTDEERALITDAGLAKGALVRAAVAGGASEAMQTLVLNSFDGITSSFTDAGTLSSKPASAFMQIQRDLVSDEGLAMQLKLVDLMPALLQADLEGLNELADELVSKVATSARGVQYGKTLVEWQNFKATTNAGYADKPFLGTGKGDPERSRRDARVDRAGIAGVLEVQGFASSDPAQLDDVAFTSFKLIDAEHATLSYLRQNTLPLAELALNQRFELGFVPGKERVSFGFGPDLGFQASLMSERTRLCLAILASGQVINGSSIGGGLSGEFDDVAAERIEAVANRFRALLRNKSTANL